MRVDAGTYESATRQVLQWAREPVPRYVCVANVHMTMEAHDSAEFKAIVNAADMVTSDGVPLVWMLRRLGHPYAERVYGPTLTLHVCESAADEGVPVGFYGGSPQAIEGLKAELKRRFPRLDIRYAFSPPFRPLTPDEDERVVSDILESGARILFVGLGCPKQERWMAPRAARRGRGLRLPRRAREAGSQVDAGPGTGVALPAGRRAPPAVEALPVQQPALRGLGRLTALGARGKVVKG
jgi:N-acetylglucosaminyldiphosphoundecaprenol N-acetyl-beta-D-mannosaminyltransferase